MHASFVWLQVGHTSIVLYGFLPNLLTYFSTGFQEWPAFHIIERLVNSAFSLDFHLLFFYACGTPSLVFTCHCMLSDKESEHEANCGLISELILVSEIGVTLSHNYPLL